MNKIILKLLNLTEKLHLIIYQLTIVFTLLFYVVLKFASGHKFIITNEEKIYSSILFMAFILSGLFKERVKFGKKVNNIIFYLFIVFATITLGISLYFLYFSITFDYEFWESPIMISITGFILPIIFAWINFYLIKKIIKELVR